MAESRLRIAIIGGGLAGATLANVLIQIPHVAVHVYESTPEFSSRGAAIVLTNTSQKSFQRAIPSAPDILKKTGAVPKNSTQLILGSGPEAGAVIADLGNSGTPGLVVSRFSLLRELLSLLPKEILYTSKKLTKIIAGGDYVDILFEDGTSSQFDAVIGADGIFSSVRKHVVGTAADEAYSASPAGFWDSRNLIPYEKAKSVLGEEYFKLDRQYGWIGDGAFIMHEFLEDRAVVQCVISVIEKDPPKDRRKRQLTKEYLTEILSNWLDGPIAKGMIELTLDQPEPSGYSQWEHKLTLTYAKDHVCIVGDAAHSMTPWQGFGAGMAIEDAMVLGVLFRNISSPQGISAAFKAFDAMRRVRCERIIHSSQGTGVIMCGRNEEVGLDVDKFRQSLFSRWDVIDAIDYDVHEQEALEKLRETLTGGN
ncbi:FAD/NAD(P)-binding domain-containing protein [Hypoxylon trugodes]|uniref:FAD/NAD(P)-binding domain-containing protein n=1 Tax=Hypoxylon trugodes TaxID=326681 RepID=UPI0021A1982C|nr:FAD/NAD(P)-binding domain-containing protein [Hypoxylon trugodes]KAI1392730.1 FAD/NAD(P)-binding domain-containing protein [Hypoxylon trugodes]